MKDGDTNQQGDTLSEDQQIFMRKFETIQKFIRTTSSDNFDKAKNLRISNNIALEPKETVLRAMFEGIGYLIFLLVIMILILLLQWPWYLSFLPLPLLAYVYRKYYNRFVSKGKAVIKGYDLMSPEILFDSFNNYAGKTMQSNRNSMRIEGKDQYLKIIITPISTVFELVARQKMRKTKKLDPQIKTIVSDFMLWFEIILHNNSEGLKRFFDAQGESKYQDIFLTVNDGLSRFRGDLPSSENHLPVTYNDKRRYITIGEPHFQISIWVIVWFTIGYILYLAFSLNSESWKTDILYLIPFLVCFILYTSFFTTTLKLKNIGDSSLKIFFYPNANYKYQFNFLYLFFKYHLRHYYSRSQIESETHYGKNGLKFKWLDGDIGYEGIWKWFTIHPPIMIYGKKKILSDIYTDIKKNIGSEIVIPDPNDFLNFMEQSKELDEYQSHELETSKKRKTKAKLDQDRFLHLNSMWLNVLMFLILGSVFLSFVPATDYSTRVNFDQTAEVTDIYYLIEKNQLIKFDLDFVDANGDGLKGNVSIYFGDELEFRQKFDHSTYNAGIRWEKWIETDTEGRILLITKDAATIQILEGIKFAEVMKIGLMIYFSALIPNLVALNFIKRPPTRQEGNMKPYIEQLYSVEGFIEDTSDRSSLLSPTIFIASYVGLIILMFGLMKAYIWYNSFHDLDYVAKMSIGYGSPAISAYVFAVLISFFIINIFSARTNNTRLKILIYIGTWLIIPFTFPNGHLWLLHPLIKLFGL